MIVTRHQLALKAYADPVWALELPAAARIIHLDVQRLSRKVFLFAEHDAGDELVTRHFRAIEVGDEIDRAAVHRGTFQAGSFFWHLYELPGPPPSE